MINSIQSVELCEYLLSHGAEINATNFENKTALHFAIEENKLETTKLLLRKNANPFLKSCHGDDPLQVACLDGAEDIFKFLVDNVQGYGHERVASTFELIGSTFLDEQDDMQKALNYWKAAIQIRQRFNVTKFINPAKTQYKLMLEFTCQQVKLAINVDLQTGL